jgi:hypothetical protein
LYYYFLHADRSQTSDISRPDCRDAFDQSYSAALAVLRRPGKFQADERLLQGGFVGHFADHFVFPCGFYVLSKATIPVDCALHGFCSLVCGCAGASMAAQ